MALFFVTLFGDERRVSPKDCTARHDRRGDSTAGSRFDVWNLDPAPWPGRALSAPPAIGLCQVEVDQRRQEHFLGESRYVCNLDEFDVGM
jgi:hypothetical protein